MNAILHIRREDAVPAALLATLLLVTVASMVIGKAARDAIFLSRFSVVQMTATDLATMVAIAVAVAVQLRMNARMTTKRLLLWSPICFAIGDVALWLGLSRSHYAWIAWVAYLWIGVQAALSVPHAFVLGSRVLNIRQGRRLCGLIGAGATLGGIGGGLATQLLAARLGTASLLLAAGMLTALCPVIVALAWQEGTGRCASSPGSLRKCASLVWTSRHLRAMACLGFASSAVTSIAGLQFKAIAGQSIHSPEHLAAFFGSFSLVAGLVALASQVLVTPRVLNRLGLGAALTIAPAALVAGSLGVLFSGTLIAAVILKGSDQVLRYSVDRTAVDLLYRPLPPHEIFEGRMLIDAIICRIGDAAGALAAFAGVAVFHLSFPFLSVISVAAIIAWFASAAFARGGYRAGLLERLRQCTGPRVVESLVRNTVDRRGLLDPDPANRLEVLRTLTRAPGGAARSSFSDASLRTALAAEIVGFVVLVETALDQRQACRDAIERISRLLFLLSPDEYPRCVVDALDAGGAAFEAAALEYLDTTLAEPHREILVPRIERWAVATA
ncbi:MAG: Npt1/Npt2 family nucleotide transporter [Vicinamibacterales bacterium]